MHLCNHKSSMNIVLFYFNLFYHNYLELCESLIVNNHAYIHAACDPFFVFSSSGTVINNKTLQCSVDIESPLWLVWATIETGINIRDIGPTVYQFENY